MERTEKRRTGHSVVCGGKGVRLELGLALLPDGKWGRVGEGRGKAGRAGGALPRAWI